TKATPCEADGLPDVPTIDQVLAYSTKFYPTTPPLRALHISQGVTNAMSFSDLGIKGGPVQQLSARANPLDVWSDVFGGPGSTGVMSKDPSRADKDALLVDRVYQDYMRLRQNKRLSAADKQMVNQYVNLVAELGAKLRSKPVLSCTQPMAPQAMANNNGLDP